jgi:DNA-directed RNA polymerase specialized sigma24 family protein
MFHPDFRTYGLSDFFFIFWVIFAFKPALINKAFIMAEMMEIEDVAAERKAVFMNLYQKAFPLVARYVSSMGGSFEEAKDIFQDALVIYYEKLTTAPVALQHSEKAYLLGIAKHLWARKNNNKQRYTPLDGSLEGIAAENDPASSTEKLMELLNTAGHKCMELLRAFYYDKLPLHKISGLFGFSGTRSATVQKYKCLEKIRDTVKEKSLTYEDFLE